jgi:hypothetical protein
MLAVRQLTQFSAQVFFFLRERPALGTFRNMETGLMGRKVSLFLIEQPLLPVFLAVHDSLIFLVP